MYISINANFSKSFKSKYLLVISNSIYWILLRFVIKGRLFYYKLYYKFSSLFLLLFS